MTGKEESSLHEGSLKGDYREILSWEMDKLNVMSALRIPRGGRSIQANKSPEVTYPRDTENSMENPGSRSLLAETCRDPAFKSASDWKRVYFPPRLRDSKEGNHSLFISSQLPGFP